MPSLPIRSRIRSLAPLALGVLAAACAASAPPAPVLAEGAADPVTYADLAAHADAAPLVLRATVERAVEVEPERAPGLAPAPRGSMSRRARPR